MVCIARFIFTSEKARSAKNGPRNLNSPRSRGMAGRPARGCVRVMRAERTGGKGRLLNVTLDVSHGEGNYTTHGLGFKRTDGPHLRLRPCSSEPRSAMPRAAKRRHTLDAHARARQNAGKKRHIALRCARDGSRQDKLKERRNEQLPSA